MANYDIKLGNGVTACFGDDLVDEIIECSSNREIVSKLIGRIKELNSETHINGVEEDSAVVNRLFVLLRGAAILLHLANPVSSIDYVFLKKCDQYSISDLSHFLLEFLADNREYTEEVLELFRNLAFMYYVYYALAQE